MKALSLTQPWAHAVVHLGKRVENRDWPGCSFRGPFLIHASMVEVQPVPFVPCKGALGFFHVDDRWLAEQLAGAGALTP